jgi:hypothetical protein
LELQVECAISIQFATTGDLPINKDGVGFPHTDVPIGKKPRNADVFIQWMQVGLARKLEDHATRSALKKNHLLVLMVLLNNMEFGNRIILTQREIAELLRFPESRLSAVLSVLEDLDLLTRISGVKRTFTLMLNPSYFLKQSKSMWAEIQEEYGDLRQARVDARTRMLTQVFPCQDRMASKSLLPVAREATKVSSTSPQASQDLDSRGADPHPGA